MVLLGIQVMEDFYPSVSCCGVPPFFQFEVWSLFDLWSLPEFCLDLLISFFLEDLASHTLGPQLPTVFLRKPHCKVPQSSLWLHILVLDNINRFFRVQYRNFYLANCALHVDCCLSYFLGVLDLLCSLLGIFAVFAPQKACSLSHLAERLSGAHAGLLTV